ncbi:methyltransferase domain-containing protein [Nocardiopsis eucommiae]|uniref:Methyltransferase domain-containing protein n=1 Tax=Nocardiopsis eucommiae TaxID=2831970 RepID=A0A975LBZ2_9ACTN|nr:methyltransferase domain-containing protein [Nocardiopsis eucommiae]
MRRTRSAPEAIGRMYDERSPIGDELRDGQLHMWYWYDDADEATLPEAVHRITRKVTDTLGLRPGEHLLDAGCGPGETAVYLTTEFGARVTGITVSDFEVAKATERAATAGVDDRAVFQHGDYASLDFPDGSFDAVLALETLQYANDLDQVLREFHRVLRPGGRLSFSDFSLESAHDPERIDTFAASLGLSVLPTLDEWLRHLRDAGFEVEEYTQCGPRVFGRKSKYLRVAMERREEVAAKFGEEALDGYSAGLRGFFAPRRDQIGYVIASARRTRAT